MTAAHVLRDRVGKHLEQIQDDRDFFDQIASGLGLEGWTAAWLRQGTFEQGRDARALERSFEQIVNDVQEMAELLETAAYNAGLAPDPRPVSQPSSSAVARDAWWAAADALGLAVEKVDRSHAPGRWRRLAFLGRIDHQLATDLKSASDTRQLFAHGYAQRNPGRAADVWNTMAHIRAHLADLLGGLDSLLEDVAPSS